ncbi:MAG: hypothetical protein HLX51_01805 [Micrococcaceae bacterium]|nr:hypothetical protein [Micrococcaceae bacterium]
MRDNNGRDKIDDEFNDDALPEDHDDQPHDDDNVRVVYVQQRRRGPLSWFGNARDRFRSAGRRWVQLSVDQPLKHQDKLPDWMHTSSGRWIILGILGVIMVGWMVIFGLVS